MSADAAPRARWKTLGALWAAKIAFLAVVAWAILRDFDAARFGAAVRAVGVAPLLLCFGIDTLFFVIETVRLMVLSNWRYPFGLLLRSRYLSALIGSVLPGLGASDLVRVFLIDRARPGDKTGILVLLLGNRVYGLLSLVSLGVVALSQPAGAFLLARAHGWGPAIVLGLAILTAPLWLRWRWLQARCEWLLQRLPGAVGRFGSRAFAALLEMTHLRQWAFAVVSCTVTNLLVVSEFWVLSSAVGTGISFGQWCLFVPFVALATMLPLGIGAVGTQEAALLAASRLAGVRFEPLLTVSFAMHLVRIGGTLPGLAFSGDAIQTVQALRSSRRTAGPSTDLG